MIECMRCGAVKDTPQWDECDECKEAPGMSRVWKRGTVEWYQTVDVRPPIYETVLVAYSATRTSFMAYATNAGWECGDGVIPDPDYWAIPPRVPSEDPIEDAEWVRTRLKE